MSKKIDSVSGVDAVVGILALVLASFLWAAVWLCFDDKLAEVVGVPALGTFSYWQSYAAMIFLRFVFNGLPKAK